MHDLTAQLFTPSYIHIQYLLGDQFLVLSTIAISTLEIRLPLVIIFSLHLGDPYVMYAGIGGKKLRHMVDHT